MLSPDSLGESNSFFTIPFIRNAGYKLPDLSQSGFQNQHITHHKLLFPTTVFISKCGDFAITGLDVFTMH